VEFFSRHINKEEQRYKDIFEKYYAQVFTHIARKVKGRENVTDITQNVFSHLWEYRKSLGKDTENIIFNSCKQEISKFFKTQQKSLISEVRSLDQKSDDADEQLISKLINEDRLQTITKTIDSLPPLRKKIFTMHKLESIKQKAIADQLQIPQYKVKHHISQAMLFLKNNVEQP
jgi:RNA polymerase sigma-70 factor (ECF subfamily)